MKVLETERLTLRWLDTDDADFILELLNTPSWIQFIGDRGIHTIEDAQYYIASGPMDMYTRLGFGLYAVELKDSLTRIGICGLIKRDTLDDVDVGYALLPSFWGKGYAYEAVHGTVSFARQQLKLNRIVAITSIDNDRSVKLLQNIGFQFERMIQINDHEQLKLYVSELSGLL